MKAITIIEPWASMIAHGFKTIETRSWPTSYRGKIAIHAGKGTPKKEWMDNVPEMMEMIDGDVHPGCIVAYADLVDCKLITEDLVKEIKANHAEYISGFYKPGRYAFVLDNIRPVDPVEVNGKQRLWNYDERRQINAVATDNEY